MAMGMTVSAASIAKAVLVREWVNATDPLAVGFSISNLTCVELFLGVTAACLPSFKPTIQRLLNSMGPDFNFAGSFSFLQSIHGAATTAEAPQGSAYENIVASNNAMNTNTLYSMDMTDLSKQSIRAELEGLESGSEQGRNTPGGSHQSGDIA
jgi:hypothetical protein